MITERGLVDRLERRARGGFALQMSQGTDDFMLGAEDMSCKWSPLRTDPLPLAAHVVLLPCRAGADSPGCRRILTARVAEYVLPNKSLQL